MKSLFFLDLARHAIGAHDIGESRPPGHIDLFSRRLAHPPSRRLAVSPRRTGR
jgi:hypothetical protein